MPSACSDILLYVVHQYEMILLNDNFLLTCLGSVHCSIFCSTTPDKDLNDFYIWRIGGRDQIDQITSIVDSIQIPPEKHLTINIIDKFRLFFTQNFQTRSEVFVWRIC